MPDNKSGKNDILILLIMYYFMLALMSVAGFFPELRMWGINWWAYQSFIVQLVYVIIGIVAGPILVRRFRKERKSVREQWGREFGSAAYLPRIIVLIIVYSLALIVLMGTTHFLGDGYQLLARLADNSATLKIWDKGAAILYNAVYLLLGEGGEAGALSAYRLVSVGSGILLLMTVVILSRPLFKYNLTRFLFVFGLVSSGYMLMFFGYVENYPLLIVSMMIYGLLGVLVVQGKVSRWWLLPPFIIAVTLHIFGFTLVPSLIYIFARNTAIVRRLEGMSWKALVAVAASICVLGGVVYQYLYSSDYFFTFALMPLFPDRFTVDHDWLFSLKHIVDMVNLLVMMVPGLLLVGTVCKLSHSNNSEKSREYIFLWIMFISAALVVYLFNPGIGMPRNWDLFSIAGVPLALLSFYYLLNRPQPISLLSTSLAIMLGLLVLFPRAIAQVSPDAGIAYFKNYLNMDKVRSRNARRLLIDYYRKTGQADLAEKEQAQAWEDYPESVLNRQGKDLMYRGDYLGACRYFQEALEINPIYHDAYANLGGCLIILEKYDSALVLSRIADGLTPYSASTLNNIGTAYLRLGNYEDARTYFRKAFSIDSLKTNALMGLVTAELTLGDNDQALAYLTRLYSGHQVQYDAFRQAGDEFVDHGAFEHARQAYRYALALGLDSSYVNDQILKHPQLAP